MSKITERGFTLIEMAIVMIIAGILVSLLASALLTYLKESRVRTTEYRLEKIEEALVRYLSVNGKYPCAADRTLGPDAAQFGREVTINCNAGAFAGTVRNNNVRIGAVPTRTLSLPDEFITDGWGNKFTYAVTENQATPLLFTADGGRISVIDSFNNSLVTPADSGHFIVVSHGETGDGSFTLNANAAATVACPAASQDAENCDDDNVFRATLVNSDANINNFYDDYVYYKGQTSPVLVIPEGAVMAFNLDACPDGWTEYLAARGRFMIGTAGGATPTTLVEDQYAFGVAVNGSGVVIQSTIALQRNIPQGGEDRAIIPPFIPLLYCEKI